MIPFNQVLLLLNILPVNGQLSVVWSYQSGSSATDQGWGLAVDPSTKDVVLAGYAEGAVNGQTFIGSRNWVAVKLNSAGVLQWTYQTGEGGSFSQIYDAAIDSSSNVLLVGKHKGSLFGSAVGEDDIAVVKLNSAGTQQWSFMTGSTGHDTATCVAIDSSGNVIVGGWTRGTISGHTHQGAISDGVLLKLNSAGAQQWLHATDLGTSGADSINSCTVDSSATWTASFNELASTKSLPSPVRKKCEATRNDNNPQISH